MMNTMAHYSRVLADSPRTSVEKRVYIAFGVGMAINLISIYVGDPYLISLLMIPIAVVATIKWLEYPVPWVVLVSVIASNPVNLNASIAFNLIFAVSLFIVKMEIAMSLPRWLFLALFAMLLSVIGSVYEWETTGTIFTQLASIGNYLVGPFFLLPLVYCRLQQEENSELILKSFVLSFLIPSTAWLLLARFLGTPVIDITSITSESLLNQSVYHVGGTVFQLTRTQVGFPLAVLICISFAIIVGGTKNNLGSVAARCVVVASIYLLLVTGSVGSFLAALCGIGMILSVASRYVSIGRFLSVIPVVFVMAVVGWTVLPKHIQDYAESRYIERKEFGASDRVERWKDSLDYLIKNPTGRGWDLYVSSIRTNPHNDYLSYGIAYGILCSFIYFAVPILLLKGYFFYGSRTISPAQLSLMLAGIGAVMVLFVNSFSDHLTANRWYFNVTWSVVWFCWFSQGQLNQEQKRTLCS